MDLLVGGGGAGQPWCQMSLLVSYVFYTALSKSPICQQYLTIVKLLLTTEITIFHFASANFYCFTMYEPVPPSKSITASTIY